MHLQQCSVITTQSTSIFFIVKENLHQTCEDYRFPILARKCHKNDTYSDTNMEKNAVRRAHARCANWHPKKLADCLLYIVISVCMQCGALACMCKQYLTHSFHSSDSSGRPCLQIADRDSPRLVFLHLEMKVKECWGLDSEVI